MQKTDGPITTNWELVSSSLKDLKSRGEFSSAASILKYALKEAKSAGVLDPRLIPAVHELAGDYCARRKYSEAENLYQQGLDAQEQILGASHPDLADSLDKLSIVLRETRGKSYAMAAAFRARSLARKGAHA